MAEQHISEQFHIQSAIQQGRLHAMRELRPLVDVTPTDMLDELVTAQVKQFAVTFLEDSSHENAGILDGGLTILTYLRESVSGGHSTGQLAQRLDAMIESETHAAESLRMIVAGDID